MPGLLLVAGILAFAGNLPPTPRVVLLVLGAATLVAYAIMIPYLIGAFYRYEARSWGQLSVWLRGLVAGEKLGLPDVPVKVRPTLNLVEQTIESQTERLGTLAIIDPASGALSRQGLLRRLRDEVERARRFERSLSILAISYPAEFGESAEFANTVRRYARAVDLVAKTSPDTHVMLLPETSSAGAEELAKRLQADWDNTKDHQLSVGLVTMPADGVVAEQLLKRAERAAQSELHSTPTAG